MRQLFWLALTLVALMWANSRALGDEGAEKKFTNSKLSYIRRFAWPERDPLKPEALFIEKESRVNSAPPAKGGGKPAEKSSAPAADVAKPADNE